MSVGTAAAGKASLKERPTDLNWLRVERGPRNLDAQGPGEGALALQQLWRDHRRQVELQIVQRKAPHAGQRRLKRVRMAFL